MIINEFHRAILADYGDGDFAHLAQQVELSQEDLEDLGDGLLRFLLVELSDEEDCEDHHVAVGRIYNAREDLDVALAALETLHEAMEAKIEEMGT